ncbi:CAP domain-containing protein [Pseudonocardia sp. TRM90224]|uniref:CAP domain-containing protein n=1 Tax=Pseudonocardia sp. TRM90224 TaxID=2812678 RepID=UPI001E524F6A|nr:CAP domain-containing protein [Pseudonocardia sp. TRM90224]
MVADLTPGANIAMPDDSVEVGLRGPFDLYALVVNGNGKVSGDADMVFYNAPSAQGVRLRDGTITVTPSRLRRGAARVVVVASPERLGTTFAALPPPHATLADARGRAFARVVAPALRTETVLLLAEVYERGGGWRVRAVGQGYADGLAGLARDFGVTVDDEGTPDAPGAPSDLVLEVVAATNVERARHRLRPLTVDARLTAAAQAHTEDMVRRGFFAHENPDGKQVWDRALAAGYAYRKVAENIAAGQRTAAEVVQGWMDSPGHRRNILDGDLTQIGVGHVPGGSYGVYWTQVFGTPR